MSITSEKREALLRKIQALQQMTVQNGCTEAEAAQAAETAQRMMDEYGLSLSEVEAARKDEEVLTENDFHQTGREFTSKLHHVRFVAGALARFTNTKIWYHGSRIHFFGFTADVQTAKYLTGVIQTAMDFEWKAYYKAHKDVNYGIPNRESARREFMIGMAHRLRERLKALKLEHDMAAEPTGESRALVVVKAQIIEAGYAALGLNLSKARGYTYTRSSHLEAGQRAAERVNLPFGGLNPGSQSKRLK
jgi:hypothetical protein